MDTDYTLNDEGMMVSDNTVVSKSFQAEVGKHGIVTLDINEICQGAIALATDTEIHMSPEEARELLEALNDVICEADATWEREHKARMLARKRAQDARQARDAASAAARRVRVLGEPQ
jgi:hypothetical protein